MNFDYVSTYSYQGTSTMDRNVLVGIMVITGIFITLVLVASILNSVFWGLAAYYDAKSIVCPNPGMWGLLVGFLGWIPGIIYLVIRNNHRNKIIGCPSCGMALQIAAPECVSCHAPNPYAAQFSNQQAAEQAKKAKRYLIAGICMFAAVLIVTIIYVVAIMIFTANII